MEDELLGRRVAFVRLCPGELFLPMLGISEEAGVRIIRVFDSSCAYFVILTKPKLTASRARLDGFTKVALGTK